MPWISLETEKVREKLYWPELEAFTLWHLEPGQEDPLPAIISSVVNEVRGFVSGCHRNTLGDAGTIPEELELAALSIIRWSLASRSPAGSELMDDVRKDEYEKARGILDKVSECKFGITQPEGAHSDCDSPTNSKSGRWGGGSKVQF